MFFKILSTRYVLQTLLTQKRPRQNFSNFYQRRRIMKKHKIFEQNFLQKIDLLGFAKWRQIDNIYLTCVIVILDISWSRFAIVVIEIKIRIWYSRKIASIAIKAASSSASTF